MKYLKKLKMKRMVITIIILTDNGYEKLALNFADIRNKIAEQRQIILSYKDYYESGKDKYKYVRLRKIKTEIHYSKRQ